MNLADFGAAEFTGLPVGIPGLVDRTRSTLADEFDDPVGVKCGAYVLVEQS
jgi:hypothetical protein